MRNWHVKISEWIIIGSFVVVVITTFTQIFFRYVINYSLPWADELSRYCFVWLVYSGILISLNRGEHAYVSILTDRLSGTSEKMVSFIADLLVLILLICITIGGIKFIQLSVGQYTSALRIPKLIVYLALPFCGFVMIYEILIRMIARLFPKKEVPN